jgi:energy-coupling factor transporter ATP-binding protein EcfA2
MALDKATSLNFILFRGIQMTLVQSREEKIARILTGRAPFLKDIQEKRERLQQVADAIQKLEDQRRHLLKDGPPSMIDSLKSINLGALVGEIEQEIHELEKPQSRFSRTTLNIGVIGRTGQGKSTLLLSLSGLSPEVIPTGQSSYCTGARSLILHNNDERQGGATIHFYSEGEFLKDVLSPYYEKLELGTPPTSLRNFAHHPLPPLGNTHKGGHTKLGEMHRYLQSYQTNIQTYQDCIGSPPLSIPTSDVRQYIAQDSPDGKKRYSYYLAVKEARITQKFGYQDIGKIALLDMPGLGDMRIADEKHLMQALGEHIDTVLFVIKPDADRGVFADVNFDLYDLAYTAFKGIPLKSCSFMVFNHRKSFNPKDDNGKNCQLLKDEIESGSRGIAGRRVEVKECFIADCSNPEEAMEKVLGPILDGLTLHMVTLDQAYLSFWHERYMRLKERIVTEFARVSNLSGLETPQFNEDKMFEEDFDKTWKQLAGTLDTLLGKLREKSHKSNIIFETYFTDKIQECKNDPGLPTIEQIKQIRDAEGSYYLAFGKLLDHLRTHLTHHFIDMDEKLQIPLGELKNEVAHILMREGQLQNFLAEIGAKPEQFFPVMIAQETLSEHLRETLRIFAGYQLSFRGYFQSLIRTGGYLNNLIPDKTPYSYLSGRIEHYLLHQTLPGISKDLIENLSKRLGALLVSSAAHGVLPVELDKILQALPGLDRQSKEKLEQSLKALLQDDNPADPRPEEMLLALTNAHKETVGSLDKKLKGFFSEPSKAALAAVEEFADQALRAGDIRTNQSVRLDWERFYRIHKSKVWSIRYSQTSKWQEYHQRWQKMVQEAQTVVQHL